MLGVNNEDNKTADNRYVFSQTNGTEQKQPNIKSP